MEIDRSPSRLPSPVEYPEEANYYPLRVPQEELAVPLTHYLWVLKKQRWRIVGFVFVVVTAVLLFSLQMTPIYETIATLEIENRTQLFELGDGGIRFDSRNFDTVMATQMELLDSSEIAKEVIRELRLNTHPDFNPALRKRGGMGELLPASPRKGAAELPPTLPGLSVRRRPETYLLEIHYRSPNPQLAAAIANAVARAFVQQGFMSQYQTSAELQKWLSKQLEELKAKLERSQQALRKFEIEHNVVNPEDRTNLMNLQLQHLQDELTKAQAERVRKQSAYESVEAGDLELLAVSEQGEPLLRLAERLDLLEAQLNEASAQYGPNHPNYKKLEAQVARNRASLESTKRKVLSRLEAEYKQAQSRENALTQAVATQKAEVDRLSTWASEYGILKREVESQTKLYDDLLKKVNEAGINASMKATNLRLAGAAGVPTEPISPAIKLNVLLALLLSTTAAVGVALAADYLDRTLRSSEQVEQWLNLPVMATLPRVPGKKIIPLLLNRDLEKPGDRSLAKAGLPLTEALSILRTSILLSAPTSELKTVLVASAAPSEGKSTVATGLALALAQQLANGDRVLLVDSDLRRPTIHNIFALANRVGLSTVLEGQSTLPETIQSSGRDPNLMVLPAGPSPRHTSELLTMHMAKVLENVRQDFRFVVIDSAPLLVCADTTILSTMADGVLLITRAGDTSRDAVAAALRQLRRVRANVLGLVLNHVSLPDLSTYNYYYGGYYYTKKEEID